MMAITTSNPTRENPRELVPDKSRGDAGYILSVQVRREHSWRLQHRIQLSIGLPGAGGNRTGRVLHPDVGRHSPCRRQRPGFGGNAVHTAPARIGCRPPGEDQHAARRNGGQHLWKIKREIPRRPW